MLLLIRSSGQHDDVVAELFSTSILVDEEREMAALRSAVGPYSMRCIEHGDQSQFAEVLHVYWGIVQLDVSILLCEPQQ